MFFQPYERARRGDHENWSLRSHNLTLDFSKIHERPKNENCRSDFKVLINFSEVLITTKYFLHFDLVEENIFNGTQQSTK